jgi:hypothetical protein
MRIGRIAVFLVMLTCLARPVAMRSQGPIGPLPDFRGTFRISNGPTGTLRIADALGNSYAEWTLRIGEPSHELRMLVGARRADGTFPVWRFEQEPAPTVAQDGIGRLEGQAFVAEFRTANGNPGKLIRERWTRIGASVRFDLEAEGEGSGPVRVGGFTAVRQ